MYQHRYSRGVHIGSWRKSPSHLLHFSQLQLNLSLKVALCLGRDCQHESQRCFAEWQASQHKKQQCNRLPGYLSSIAPHKQSLNSIAASSTTLSSFAHGTIHVSSGHCKGNRRDGGMECYLRARGREEEQVVLPLDGACHAGGTTLSVSSGPHSPVAYPLHAA